MKIQLEGERRWQRKEGVHRPVIRKLKFTLINRRFLLKLSRLICFSLYSAPTAPSLVDNPLH